jgi:hypothetical protein
MRLASAAPNPSGTTSTSPSRTTRFSELPRSRMPITSRIEYDATMLCMNIWEKSTTAAYHQGFDAPSWPSSPRWNPITRSISTTAVRPTSAYPSRYGSGSVHPHHQVSIV